MIKKGIGWAFPVSLHAAQAQKKLILQEFVVEVQ